MSELLLHFKFRWVDENGNETGFFSKKKGSFDGQELILDDIQLQAANITSM